MRINGVYTAFLAGKLLYIRSYTVYIPIWCWPTLCIRLIDVQCSIHRPQRCPWLHCNCTVLNTDATAHNVMVQSNNQINDYRKDEQQVVHLKAYAWLCVQVASHAQKYFIRLNSLNKKDKRRASIHDITHWSRQHALAPCSSLFLLLPTWLAQGLCELVGYVPVCWSCRTLLNWHVRHQLGPGHFYVLLPAS